MHGAVHRASTRRHHASSARAWNKIRRRPVSSPTMDAAHDRDALDELLAQVSLRARISFRGRLCERWAVGGISQGRLGFHAVLGGRCWVRVPGSSGPVQMLPGGILIYRPLTEHLLAHSMLTQEALAPLQVLPMGGAHAGPNVDLLCGYFDGGPANAAVISALPAYLLWPRREDFPAPLGRLMEALAACALDERRCVSPMLERLLEVLLNLILREPGMLPAERIGVIRAQRDPALVRALDAIHAQPARRWTLAALAGRAGISRSAFAARFKQVTDLSVMHYVRRYRVALAERRIREERLPVEEAARASGYRNARTLRRATRRR